MPSPDCPPRATTFAFRRLALAWVPAVFASGLLLSACSPLLSLIFEPPPPGKVASPHPIVRQPRHPVPEKPPPPPAEDAFSETAPPTDWLAQYELLPRDADGAVNWVQALEQKLIAPKPGIDPEAKDEDTIDLDLDFVPKGQPELKVVFSHKAHTEWLVCANCHTAIFPMEHSPESITMAKIMAGEACGRCHDKVVVAPPSGCSGCHVGMR